MNPNRIAGGFTDEVVHFNDAGYRALVASIDLSVLRASSCVS